MLQNPCKTLGFKKNMVYKIPPGGGGKPYPASGLKQDKIHQLDIVRIRKHSTKILAKLIIFGDIILLLL